MLYHECRRHDCEWWAVTVVLSFVPKPDCGISSDRRSLWWSRDEVARHFHRVILLWPVQPNSLPIVAEDYHGLGLGGLTFLQLSTTLRFDRSGSQHRVRVSREGPPLRLVSTFSTNIDISRQERVPLDLSAHCCGGNSGTLVYG